jgi:methyl-accepting chemotaxis protein
MSRKGLIITVIIFLVILGAIIIYLWTFRKSDLSVSSKKADVEIRSGELIQSFEKNEKLANEAYLNKIIVLAGTVDNISEDSLTVTVYLKDKDAVSGIICSFNKSVLDISKISKGSKIKVKGICSGYLLDVVLNKCSLEE